MKRTFLTAALLSLMTLTACTGVVTYRASTPPPPLRVETYGPAPGPGFFWINGYWGWGNGGYAWVPGRWAARPRPRAVWVEPRWERQGRYYRMREGRWR